MLSLIIFIIFFISFLIYYILIKNHDYWEKRNVPYSKPMLIFGNYRGYALQQKYGPEVASEIYKQYPNDPYVGTFYGTAPALLVKDPKIIRLILAKDFYYFNSKETTKFTHKEVITKSIVMNGGDEWKVVRSNLNPHFTPAKIKNMFPLVEDCTQELDVFLESEIKLSRNINVRSLLARYTMDCIISCCFGINANAMKGDGDVNPFMLMGEAIFDNSIVRGLKMVCRSMWPGLFYNFGFKLFDERISSYFSQILNQVSKSRLQGESARNDFVNLFMDWKAKSYITCDSINNFKTNMKETFKMEITDDLLAGVSLALFGAGFETTATTMTFVLYELAKNEISQKKVIDEVDLYLRGQRGVIKYDCVNEMPYLEACIEETLRLYPVFGLLTREVMEEYSLPTGLHLKVGDRIHILVHHIHRDENNFSEPDSFHPERFLGDEKKNIKPFTFLPFGEGPRICIGLRFAKIVIYLGLITILKNYTVALAENTPLKLKFKPSSFVVQSVKDIHLDFVPR